MLTHEPDRHSAPLVARCPQQNPCGFGANHSGRAALVAPPPFQASEYKHAPFPDTPLCVSRLHFGLVPFPAAVGPMRNLAATLQVTRRHLGLPPPLPSGAGWWHRWLSPSLARAGPLIGGPMKRSSGMPVALGCEPLDLPTTRSPQASCEFRVCAGQGDAILLFDEPACPNAC